MSCSAVTECAGGAGTAYICVREMLGSETLDSGLPRAALLSTTAAVGESLERLRGRGAAWVDGVAWVGGGRISRQPTQ